MRLIFGYICVIFVTALPLGQPKTVVVINQRATGRLSGTLPKLDPKTQAKILESYGKLPLSFEANHGRLTRG